MAKIYQAFKEKTKLIFFKLFHKIEEDGILPKSCYLASITPMPKSDKDTTHKKIKSGGASRWQKSKTRRSPSSPQIHQKYIYMWNNSYRTPTEDWQKSSDFPKGKKLPTYLAVWLTGSWCSGQVSGLSL